MSEYTWLNVLDVGRQIGVPERTFIPPIPGETRMVTEQTWSGELLEQAIALVAPYKEKGGTVVVTGHADVWILLSIANSLKPECEILYATQLDGPTSPVQTIPLFQLPMGRRNPELRLDYTMRIEGDNCYINYRTDDPDAPVGVVHTFDNHRVGDLILPAVPEHMNLFLHAKGSYYVQMNITNSYCNYVKSIWTAYHDSDTYHCAYSSVPEIKVGQSVPREKTYGKL